MGFRILADMTVGLHLLFVLFAVLGGVLIWRWPRMAWLHLPAVLWAACIEFFGWICPLTYLENHFLLKAGHAGYPGGFIEQYLMPILYPAALTRQVQFLLGAGVVVINAGIYFVAWRRLKRSDNR